MKKFIKFIGKNKLKMLMVVIFLILGGPSSEKTIEAGVSTLLFIAALAIRITLHNDWKEFASTDDG